MSSIQRVRRFVLLVACAAAAAFLLASPAAARADDMYAAIAYSPKTGVFGYGFKFDYRKEAEQKALDECKADDALVVVWVKNGWCSLAAGDDDPSIIGYGDNQDRDEAIKTALAECRKLTAKVHSVISVSSDGKAQAVK